jgi:hypothetical protein
MKLQMTTKPEEEEEEEEEEGMTIKKTVLLERPNPAWKGERFDPKFLRMVRTASSRAGFYMKWIYVCWRSYIQQYSKSCFEVGKEFFGLVLCKRS